MKDQIEGNLSAMLGTGYVGLVSGACFAELGQSVACIDQDEAKIAALKRGEVPIYEPGLAELLERNTERLAFTVDLPKAVAEAEVVFLAVGTPSRRGDGEADLSFVHAAAQQTAPALRSGTIVVIKSTVVVGTARSVGASIKEPNPRVDFSIASNPEFLREGSAIDDFFCTPIASSWAWTMNGRVSASEAWRPAPPCRDDDEGERGTDRLPERAREGCCRRQRQRYDNWRSWDCPSSRTPTTARLPALH